MDLHLISHPLCPYVQRVAIALAEKDIPFRRTQIDLSAKPDWFRALSPLGKTPVLAADGAPIFESAVICEYLEETQGHPLHPTEPLARARSRGWVEVASAALNDVAGLYSAADEAGLRARAAALSERLARTEAALDPQGPWFAGAAFTLPDAAFATLFRYFDSIDRFVDLGLFDGRARLSAWRDRLAARPSVIAAAPPDYPARLEDFLRRRGSRLSALMGDG